MTIAGEAGRWRLGLRREVLILLPVALLLLVVLSTFTLLSYRNAISLLAAERQEEAARLARTVAERLAAEPVPSGAELGLLAPNARGVALLDGAGRPLAANGELPLSALLSPAGGGEEILQPLGVGPQEGADAVSGFAPLTGREGRRFVRVDLAAGGLSRQLRGLRILSAVVLTINGALVVLVVLFIRHLMAPFERLLERAKEVSRPTAGEGEIEFLVATFERGLAGLAVSERREEDDFAVIERTLVGSLQSGLLLMDREGCVLAANTVGSELLGIGALVPGTPLSTLLRDQPELCALLSAAVLQGGGLQRRECVIRTGDGEIPRLLGLTLHPLRRDDGDPRGYLALFADLTEARRRAEENRLSESLAWLGELAGGVAHELRNSLATLRGYLTLIDRRPSEGSIADYLGEIRSEADHLQRVLEDFLSFARPGSARLQELSLLPLLLRAAADPALDGFAVQVQGAEPGLRMRGDAQLLERALRNLLHNAVQAEREAGGAGPVGLIVQEGPDGLEIAVEDRGPGVNPEIRERLFHPFVTGRAGGVGLGLALAQRIVVLHRGRIRLEERAGGGTRAVIVFPTEAMET
jgi:signal transduction histidine kinase